MNKINKIETDSYREQTASWQRGVGWELGEKVTELSKTNKKIQQQQTKKFIDTNSRWLTERQELGEINDHKSRINDDKRRGLCEMNVTQRDQIRLLGRRRKRNEAVARGNGKQSRTVLAGVPPECLELWTRRFKIKGRLRQDLRLSSARMPGWGYCSCCVSQRMVF